MNRRTKLAISRDKKIKAKHSGKRVSTDGNTYYEYRENRSDVNRTKRFGKGGEISEDRINEVLDNYMIAALWSSTDMDTDEPLDANYSVSDIAPATRERMYKDVKMFIEDNYDAIEASGSTDEQLGHDLWLTRNGHGAGFFDRGYDKDVEEKLENAAREMKSVDLEVGDDGMIHQLGVFKKGGDVKGKTREEIWESLSLNQRINFLNEHKPFIKREYRKESKNTTIDIDKWATTIYSDLPNAIKQSLYLFDYFKDYAKGGNIKSKKWIQRALSGGKNKGALRRTAMRKGLLRNEDENLSMTDLHKLEKMGGKTSKRAHLAETLRTFADGGELTEKEHDLKSKIEAILEKVVPNFYRRVWTYKNYFGEGKNLGILIAASDYAINNVRGQYPQAVSLTLDLSSLELHPQIFGGNGGQAIYRNPNLDDPKEKYLAMKSVKIPFRTPNKEEGAVLKAIEKFAENYKKTLKENIDVLRYTDIVDYDALLSSKKMADGGEIEDFEQKLKDAFKQTNKWHFLGGNINGHEVQLKVFVGVKECDVQIFKKDGLHVSLGKNYVGKRETMKMIMDALQNKFESGGSVGKERYIFGIEYKATPTSRVFKKSSLTMSGKDTKEMNDAISNNAELLKKQEGWFEVRTTKTPILKEGGKLDLSKHLHSGRYISLDITPNGNLKITLDEDGRAEVLEMRDDDRNDDYIMSELFDDIRGNSELMYFDDIGAQGFGLTEAPAITDGFYYDDNGDLTDEGHDDSEVYFFERYMIDSFIDTMLEDGYVIFDRVSKSKKMAKGGRVTKNEDVLESFLESNEQVSVKNLSTHYNEHDKEVLLRNYYTLIATRKGMDVKITSKKYSQTTSTIQNKLKSLAAKKGFNIIEVEEFEEGGTISGSELKSLERSLRSSLSSGKEISEEDLETYLGRELKSEEEVVGYNVRRCFLKPYYKKIK